MRNLTALSSDRQVLGAWLDDKHIVAEHAALAALRAIEDQIVTPREWHKPLLQSVLVEKYMADRAKRKVAMFGQLYGFQEHEIISLPRGVGKTQVANALLKHYVDTFNEFNEAFDYMAAETRHAATMLCDSMCTLCHIIDRKNVKETLHAWKKT